MEPRPASRRSAKGRRTRARILSCAAQLFSESGFHAVSLREIAAAAGITHVGLLHHFDTKDALLLEVLHHRDAQLIPGLIEPTGDPTELVAGDPSHARMVFAGVMRTVRHNVQTRALVSLFVKLSAEATDPHQAAHDLFQRRYQYLVVLLRTAFETHFAHSPTSHGLPAGVAAHQLLALMDGLQLQWLLTTPTEEPPDEAITWAVDMVEAVGTYLELVGVHLTEDDYSRLERYLSSSTEDGRASSADRNSRRSDI